jgi:drug/metabolite transporter (DMT)-like permease
LNNVDLRKVIPLTIAAGCAAFLTDFFSFLTTSFIDPALSEILSSVVKLVVIFLLGYFVRGHEFVKTHFIAVGVLAGAVGVLFFANSKTNQIAIFGYLIAGLAVP